MAESYIRGKDQGDYLDLVTLGTYRCLPIQTLDATGTQNGTSTNPVRTDPTGTTAQPTTHPSTSRSDTFTATGNGVTVNVSTTPYRSYAIQVVGTGAAATSWDVRVEGSLDGVNFDQILQHTQTTGDGKILFSGTTLSPALYFRSRVAALTLGSATNIKVYIVGVQ